MTPDPPETVAVPAESAQSCRIPGLPALTAYIRGCRCARCTAAARDNRARAAARRAEKRRQEKADRERGWYSVHRDALRALSAETGEPLEWRAMGKALQKDIAPAYVSGPYTDAEDRVIVAWRGTDLMLAVALGRTYNSVVLRKQRLRRAGRLWR